MPGKIKFPRNVYKKGGPLKWSNKIEYSTEYVTTKAEYDKALKNGYIDDFNEALFGDENTVKGDFEEVEEKTEEVVEEKSKKKGFFSKKETVEDIDDDF